MVTNLLPVLHRPSYTHKIKRLFGSSVVAYWPLSEVSGSVAYDRSSYGHHGVINGGVLKGQPGIGDGRPSMLFNGTDSYINVYSTSLRDMFPWLTGTLFCWEKITTLGFTPGRPVAFAQSFTPPVFGRLWQRFAVTNKFVCDYSDNDVLSQIVPTNQFTDIAWRLLVSTWDATTFRGYQDGVEYTGGLGNSPVAVTYTGGTLASNFANIGCGRATPSFQGLFTGYIAHVGLLNRVATANEIARMYKV